MLDFFATGHLWLAIPAAVVLDLLLGDPQRWPHPVRWMGCAIEWFEPLCRNRWRNEVIAGTVFAVGLIGATWSTTFLLVSITQGLHPVLGFFTQTVLIYYCLSIRSLRDAAMEIHGLLQRKEIETARTRLSFIVSRDVDHYQAPDIARATVETVAENFVDGILSPLFYAVIGGAPLGMAYKMINTLDSMVGYKNDRYRQFGRSAARIDDVANYLPARLSILAIAVSARLFSIQLGRRAFRTGVLEGHRHHSPNAGYPEGAFAGALGVCLNGPNYYHGRLVEKPYIGCRFGPVAPHHIIDACHLLLTAALLSVAAACLIRTILSLYTFLFS